MEAVLTALPPDTDEIWALGDHVGYGPDPADVLALLRQRAVHLIAGNHDHAIGTGVGAERFRNTDAAAVAQLHREWLSAEELDRLASLPLRSTRSGVTLFHGSFQDPLTEYVFDTAVARRSLASTPTLLACNGHTHVPAVFTHSAGRASLLRPKMDQPYKLAERSLLNPGSVGQPRDGDPRAAWALLEPLDGRVTFRRTSYPVGTTQRRMRALRFPQGLIDRLSTGA